jgi:DNA-binding NtrC family response regulator
MAKASILIIDDDETIRYFLPRDLEAEGYQVTTAENGTLGLRALERDTVDLVLLDIRLPDRNGIDVLQRIRTQWPDQAVVMLTGEPDHETAVQAMRLGARDYLTKGKPIREELLAVLERELATQRLGREVQHHRQQKSQHFSREFVRGQSGSMQRVYAVVEQVAGSDSTSVLIEGESGSGKELIAHLIHELSARREKPMLEVNCAAIPRELLESELFGHEKGAFTDARQQKQGLLELANGGTLFLDEVGEMSLQIQVKLLRVLERMTFKRVGGTKDITVSVRVISATNQNLETMVREQRFREDLYYRLKVVPIRVPPLRERREDILPLARHFLAQFNRAFSKGFGEIDPDAERVLLAYPWPGNIRELRNLFERIVLLNSGDRILAPASGDRERPVRRGRRRSRGGARRGRAGSDPAGLRLDPWKSEPGRPAPPDEARQAPLPHEALWIPRCDGPGRDPLGSSSRSAWASRSPSSPDAATRSRA